MSAHPAGKKPNFVPVYITNLFLSIPYAILVYINSSYLGTLISEHAIGLLYALSSVIDILLFLNISHILRRFHLKNLFLFFTGIELVATVGLGLFHGALVSSVLFVLLDSASLASLFCLDIFLESRSVDKHTGRIRSVYLTIMNAAILVSPLFGGFIVGADHYGRAYLLAAFFLCVCIGVASILMRDSVALTKHTGRMMENLDAFLRDKPIRNIFAANVLLQFFYAWMIVYTPIYLHQYLNLDWTVIGTIFTVMLLPFVIFEIPVGRIADIYLGEKEILITGFITMAVFTLLIPFIPATHLLLLALVLFMTRVGASFVEVTTESYFWKHVNAKQSGFIGLFRLSEPIAFILGPLAALVTLWLMPFGLIFIVLACVMVIGIGFALALKDTR